MGARDVSRQFLIADAYEKSVAHASACGFGLCKDETPQAKPCATTFEFLLACFQIESCAPRV